MSARTPKVKLYNGDCQCLMAKMPSHSVSVILTSPPYNMTKRKGGNADTGRYDVYKDWKPEGEYIQWTISLFEQFNTVLSKDGVVLQLRVLNREPCTSI